MHLNSVLITGDNRGIGLGLVKQMLLGLDQPPEIILAIVLDLGRAQVCITIGKFVISVNNSVSIASRSYPS